MREELVLADLDDDMSDLKKSKNLAAGINSDHSDLVSRKELKKEYTAIQNERDMSTLENQVQPGGELDTITAKVSIPRGKNIGETTYLSIPKDSGKNGVVTAF